MSKKSGRRSRNIKVPRFGCAFAVSAVALSAIASVTPARAATVTDAVTFSITGAFDFYPTACCFSPSATATGSFDITFDPTLLYPASGTGAQSLSGVISDLTISVTNPNLSSSPLTLNPITGFTYSPDTSQNGTLILYSDYATDSSKEFTEVSDVVIDINGLDATLPAVVPGVWYSQAGYADTIMGSGPATGSASTEATPLPAALPLFATGLGALGLFGWRRKRKNVAALVAA